MKEDKILQPFFAHDYNPCADKKIMKLLISMGIEGYGLYWLVVEYMHQNTFKVGEENILAFNFRTDVEKITKLMNDFELFRIEEGCYISDRILRNLNFVEQKNEGKKQAANVRWLLSSFNKAYVEFFGQEPILDSKEVESLKKYANKIPDLKDKFRDILYTLKGLKFDTDINFKPCADWLLKDNNLGRLLNGEFGKIKHKKTEKEIKEEQKAEQLRIEKEIAERNKPTELELQIDSIETKENALNFIADYYSIHKLTACRGHIYLFPPLKKLVEKFQIADDEVLSICQH